MKREIDLLPARASDAQSIAEMSRRLVESGLPWTWTPARITRHITHPESMVLAARAGTALAGFGIMHFGDEVAHLNLLAVDSDWQGRGLGQRLMGWLEQSASTAGIFVICLEVRTRNPIALRFYRRLGYREAGRLPRYYSGREDGVRMTRDLREPGARLAAADPASKNVATPEWFMTRFKRSQPG